MKNVASIITHKEKLLDIRDNIDSILYYEVTGVSIDKKYKIGRLPVVAIDKSIRSHINKLILSALKKINRYQVMAENRRLKGE